jgi:hypothetical protein
MSGRDLCRIHGARLESSWADPGRCAGRGPGQSRGAASGDMARSRSVAEGVAEVQVALTAAWTGEGSPLASSTPADDLNSTGNDLG